MNPEMTVNECEESRSLQKAGVYAAYARGEISLREAMIRIDQIRPATKTRKLVTWLGIAAMVLVAMVVPASARRD